MRLFLPAALAAQITLAPAFAHAQGLTSAELWASWQGAVAAAGGNLTADERREGNQLVLDDLVLTPEAGEHEAIRLETMTLVSQADGSVGVLLPERFAVTLDLPPTAATGDAETVTLSVAAPGLQFLILGLGQKAEFQIAGPSVSVTLDRIDPPPAEGTVATMTAAAADLALHYKHELGVQLPVVDTALTLGTLHLELDVGDGGDLVTLGLDGAALSLALQAMVPASAEPFVGKAATVPTPPGMADLLKALEDGFAISASAGTGATEATITLNGPQFGALGLHATLASANASFRLDRTVAGWETGFETLAAALTGTDSAGTDVSGNVAASAFRSAFSAGLNGLGGAQPWALVFALREVALDERAWRLFDGTGLLDNTPLTLAVDLAGQYSVDPASLAPDWTPDPAGTPPLTRLGFGINELVARGLGVDFTGTGGLDFDFGDLVTYDGYPAPAGRLHFVTQGAYALIDKLSALSLISAEEATNARYALLVFGMAADEPDTLTTDVDFRDKSLFLNGQKLR